MSPKVSRFIRLAHQGLPFRPALALGFGAAVLIASGCVTPTSYLAPTPGPVIDPNAPSFEPPAPEEVSTHEEAGVQHLHGLLRCVDAGVQQKQFAAAEDCLNHAERGIARANSLTRSHPDFDDVAEQVQAARPRLQQAIARERRAQRDAAVAALITQGEAVYDRANVVCLAKAHTMPGPEDVASLDDSQARLTALLQAGEAYADVPAYAAHATRLQAALDAVRASRASMGWQMAAATRLAPPLQAAQAADAQAQRNTDAPQQLAAYKAAAAAYAACVQLTQAAPSEPGYAPDLLVETALGALTASQLQAQCQQALQQANARVDRFGWEHLLGQLQDLLPPAHTQGRVAAEAVGAALPLLSACSQGAPGAPQTSGAAAWQFNSPFGTLPIEALRRACSQEANKLSAKQARLEWQARLEAQAGRYAQLQQAQAAAAHADVTQRAAALGQLAGGFAECRDATAALVAEPHADRRYKAAAGERTVTGEVLRLLCAQAAREAHSALQQAQHAAVAASFRATCHNDEVAVFDREGAPAQIEPVGTGRVFVYGPDRRIAFDAAGRRTEEAALRP
jgi:hypothetical protein